MHHRGITPATSHDLVRCHIDEVNREQFLEIWHRSQYSYEGSVNRDVLPDGVISSLRSFETEQEFAAEYERLLRVAKSVSANANLEMLYYRAGSETPSMRAPITAASLS